MNIAKGQLEGSCIEVSLQQQKMLRHEHNFWAK